MKETEFKKLVKKLRLMEAEDDHRPDMHNPKVDYEYKGATNKATENEEYDRVIARLASGQSAAFTKIANQYKKINEELKVLNAEKSQLNDQTRRAIESLFPIQDDVFTRVVETKSLVVTLGKAEQAHTIEEIDLQGYIKELEKHLIPVLGDKIEDLKKKYIQIKNIPAKKSKLGQPKLLDSANQSVVESDLDMEKLETWARYGASIAKKWLTGYDEKLNAFKDKVEAVI